ncbi:MAG: spore maturation protein [Gammaproteobacteria bacterium]|nr:MAG: spore maturation protein [Gammaproteobacteria bacterium]
MNLFGVIILPLLIGSIIAYGLVKRVPVYETFIEGAREGFDIAVRIIPYLVAILFAIAMFRASGAMDTLMVVLGPVFSAIGFPAELLPMAITRPLTGSGSVGVLAEMVHTYGEDSLLVKMAATLFGSTETTFYVLAVYFGAVGIRRTRYAIQVGLMADLAGIIAAVIVCNLLFA